MMSNSRHPKLKGRLIVDPSAKIHPGADVDISGGLTVGKNVNVSKGVLILTHSHPFMLVDGGSRHAEAAPLVIEDDVFICDRAIILPQVNRIGHHAIIGAGAVVTKDVPAGAVVAGNPARVIRMRDLKKL